MQSPLKMEAAGSSERSKISTRLHSFAAHKKLLFTVTDMRTSNPLVCSGQKYHHTPIQVKFLIPLICEMTFKNNDRLVTCYYLYLIQSKTKEIQF